MNIAKKLLLSSLMAGAASLSHAAIVDFNDVPSGTTDNFKSGGFDFKLSGLYAAVALTNTTYCFPTCPVNGTPLAIAPWGGRDEWPQPSLTMTKSGGGAFALSGFEGTGSFNWNELPPYSPYRIPDQINVIGQLLGGGTVVQSFAIDKSTLHGPMPLAHYTFNGSFTNLASVTFTSSGTYEPSNGFTIDNINVNVSAVPEPESYAMLMAGLGLLGFMARRRRQGTA